MKKKLVIALLAISLVAGTTACGDKKTETKTETAKEDKSETEDSKEEDKEEDKEEAKGDYRLISETDTSKYITLGDYKGITLEKEDVAVTEEEIDSEIQNQLQNSRVTEDDKNVAVEDGDIANISYIGTLDGEAFDGGTADNYDLEIGSGSFIDGFEEGVKGMKTGETKDLNLTFPTEYPSEELAGKDVVFQVTLNEIKHIPELSDEWVAENTDSKTVDEYKKSLEKTLLENKEKEREANLVNTAFTSIYESSEVKEYPEKDIEEVKTQYEDQIKLMAEQYGMEMDELLEQQGMSDEDFDAQCQQYAEYRVKQALVVQGVMDEEGMTFDDENAETMKVKLAYEVGATNFDQIVEYYGEYDAYASLGSMMVGQFIVDNAKIEKAAATEEVSEDMEAEAEEIMEEMPEEETLEVIDEEENNEEAVEEEIIEEPTEEELEAAEEPEKAE